MFKEAQEAPEVVRRQRDRIAPPIAALAAELRAKPPRAVLTLARGSSDHAATFARYLIETRAGVMTSSLSPSVASVYDSMPDVTDTLVLAISQSGRSPDLLAAADRAVTRGARLAVMVNDEGSPLASRSDVVVPLCAGPEISVAATKSFIASLSAILHLVAAWTEDQECAAALADLPGKLGEAWSLDWAPALPALVAARSMYVVGRGHALGVAQEAALKMKETCGIQAEAFSAAEVRHGPMAMVGRDFPVLLFGQADESLDSVSAVAAELAREDARVISAGVPQAPGLMLPVPSSDPLIAPVLHVGSFYRMANALAVARGMDPDRPASLSKVTETL